jgi:hypothetical protein
MKKTRKSKPRSASSKRSTAAAESSIGLSRRAFLSRARNGAIATLALGGTGWWALSSFRSHAAAHDLTRIGQGTPTIVQIHDPTCSLCTALQRQTRRALKCFDNEITYLIADIRTPEGAAYASLHGQRHVTLMLLDGEARVTNTLHGVRTKDELKPYFETLVRPS